MEQGKSKLVIGIVIVAVGVGLLIWALSGRDAGAPSSEAEQSSTTSESSQQASEEAEADPEAAIITFTNDGFSPREITVKKGTAVTVKNESSNRVQFSSDDHPTHLENQGMNLPVLEPGGSDTFTADETGKWGFHDHIDDSKTGTLTVTE